MNFWFLPGNRAFTAFTNPGTGCGPFGAPSATGTFTAPTACCSPNSFEVRTSRYTGCRRGVPEEQRVRVVDGDSRAGHGAGTAAAEWRNGRSGARRDACPGAARARALLSCEGTDAREAMSAREVNDDNEHATARFRFVTQTADV